MAKANISPGMQQYLDIKKDYPDAFLLFRMGDFYELFYDDAVKAAQLLEIGLTSRNKNAENPIPEARSVDFLPLAKAWSSPTLQPRPDIEPPRLDREKHKRLRQHGTDDAP